MREPLTGINGIRVYVAESEEQAMWQNARHRAKREGWPITELYVTKEQMKKLLEGLKS